MCTLSQLNCINSLCLLNWRYVQFWKYSQGQIFSWENISNLMLNNFWYLFKLCTSFIHEWTPLPPITSVKMKFEPSKIFGFGLKRYRKILKMLVLRWEKCFYIAILTSIIASHIHMPLNYCILSVKNIVIFIKKFDRRILLSIPQIHLHNCEHRNQHFWIVPWQELISDLIDNEQSLLLPLGT